MVTEFVPHSTDFLDLGAPSKNVRIFGDCRKRKAQAPPTRSVSFAKRLEEKRRQAKGHRVFSTLKN
jgi:hypothetical protein